MAETEASSSLELIILDNYAQKKQQLSVLSAQKAIQNKEILVTEKNEIETELVSVSQEKKSSENAIEDATKVIAQTKKKIEFLKKQPAT